VVPRLELLEDRTVPSKASPSLATAAGPTVILGSGARLTESATLTGAPGLTGAITFALYDPNGAVVDTETAAVSGPGTYSTPHGFLPTQAGTYQWSARYGGDANNNAAGGALTTTPTVILSGVGDIYGVAIDAAGNRYVAESGPSDVAVFAPGSTTPTGYLTGVTNPTYFAFDKAGDLFVVSSFTSGLWEFAPGSTTPTATLSGVNLPQDLLFDASGNLFVSNAGDDTVSEYAPGSTAPTATMTGLNQPAALALDSSGDLFVVNLGNGTVSEFAPGSTTPTATLTGLSQPYGLAFDAAGNLFVANQGTGTVSVFAPGSTTPTATITGFSLPRSIVADSSGDVFVADWNNGTVSEFAPGSTTPTATLTGGGGPLRMAFDAQGDLYVTDYFDSTVSEFTPATDAEVVATSSVSVSDAGGVYDGSAFPATATVTGASGTPDSTLEGVGLTLDYVRLNANGTTTDLGASAPSAAGNYQVTASFPGSADYLPASATTAFTIAQASPSLTAAVGPTVPYGSGAKLTDSATLSGPSGMTGAITFVLSSPSGTVVDTETATVSGPGTYTTPHGYLPTQAGTYQWSARYGGDSNDDPAGGGALATAPTFTLGGVGDIYGVAIDSAGNRYVAESGPSDVAVFAPGSATPTGYLTGISNPTWLAFDHAGDLFVASAFTSGLWEFAPGSTTPTAYLSGTNSPRVLAFDASGDLFVSNAGGNNVTEYAPGATAPTATLTGLDIPIGLAFDHAGNLFVANLGNDTISVFTPGSTTPTSMPLTDPTLNGGYAGALAFDANGNLFAINGDDTVNEFAPGSTTPTATLTGLATPTDLNFDAAGNLYVANFNGGTVSEFAPGGTTPTATLTGVNGALRMAFDAQGDLYVTDYFDGTVSEFTPGPGIDHEVVSQATPTIAVTSSSSASVAGQLVTITATIGAAAPATGTVQFQIDGSDFGAPVALSGGQASFSTAGLSVGSHVITANYSGDVNFVAGSATVTQTVAAVTTANLQTVVQAAAASAAPVVIQAGTGTDADTVLSAVNALAAPSKPVTVVLNLGAANYSDVTASPPAGVTLVIVGNGTTSVIVGHSPALTLLSGQVVMTGIVFTTATDAPTILVTGGSLTLRNCVVQESTGYSDAAIVVSGGGSLDLGTTPSPGGNTINLNGAGAFASNTTSSPVAAVGDTFTVNGLPLTLSSLSGVVWEDFNDDGQVDFGENGISGVKVTLTGTDDLGNAVSLSQTTDGDGAYVFLNLRPGKYTLTEAQPAGYTQGLDSVGTAGGSLSATDRFSVALGLGVNGLNYNYGEQPPAGGGVKHGQTAGIGFWNNKNGQALINALNGGGADGHGAHQLGDWLAATLPHTFGVHAGGNNLAGKDNAYVAALFQQDFVMKGVKLDAQLLATALSVYATNATLDPTQVAATYGFTISGDGAGTATINVGSNGDAFAVANNTTMTLMDLLLAADAQAVNGLLYNGNAAKRNEANNVFSAVNQDGGL
jgi:sugar lactone lactonase YvrE